MWLAPNPVPETAPEMAPCQFGCRSLAHGPLGDAPTPPNGCRTRSCPEGGKHCRAHGRSCWYRRSSSGGGCRPCPVLNPPAPPHLSWYGGEAAPQLLNGAGSTMIRMAERNVMRQSQEHRESADAGDDWPWPRRSSAGRIALPKLRTCKTRHCRSGFTGLQKPTPHRQRTFAA